MKKIFLYLLFLTTILSTQAQNKFSYLNSNGAIGYDAESQSMQKNYNPMQKA